MTDLQKLIRLGFLCMPLAVAACGDDAGDTGGDDNGDSSTGNADTTNGGVTLNPGDDTTTTDTPTTGTGTETGDVTTTVDPDTGSGGTETGSDGTTGDMSACTQLTVTGPLSVNANGFFVAAATDPALGDATLPELFRFEFYAGGTTGTIDLATDVNDNYQTCEQCVRLIQDIDSEAGTIGTQFFQESGTLVIDDATPPSGGSLDVQLMSVRLVEVTIADDFLSTPVPDGACIDIVDTTLATPTPPPEWTCDAPFYGDGDCDCGCGAPDLDCPDPATVDDCVYCDTCMPGAMETCADVVDPTDVTACAEEPVPPTPAYVPGISKVTAPKAAAKRGVRAPVAAVTRK